MKFKSIKGTRDILPDESHRWQAVEESIRRAMSLNNYREIRTPLFEETSLFARSIGELTDIVGKEMYTLADRSGTSLTLRPEMTASVIRAYIQHNLGEQSPLTKVYYLGPMFRQERPQAGRLRQFHQYGAEAIGGHQPEIDGEIITLAAGILERLGIRTYAVKINSVGCGTCRPAYREILKEYLGGIFDQLSAESRQRFNQNPLRILDSKEETDRDLTADAPLMIDHLCDSCGAHFKGLRAYLDATGTGYTVDGRIVRGLDYYTKTAFEIVSTDLGSQDALTGGGRYDLLVGELGGKPTPAVGFAAGIERLLMVLEKQNILPLPSLFPTLFIASADEGGRAWAMRQIITLRRAGIHCEADYLGRSLKAQMREADRQRAVYVIVVGENEIRTGQILLKEMASGKERTIELTDLVEALKSHQGA